MTAYTPEPVFDHLLRLTDRRGTFEHARLAEPDPEHGYCTDDVARVLVVATREPGLERTLNGVGQNCVAVLGRSTNSHRCLPQQDGQQGQLDRRARPGGRLGALRLGSGDSRRAQ